MPPVKIDYVVSFSSEDPEHPASNLLLPDVKSKWLCRAGEPSCSLVLQLKTACKIESVTIGAYHVALLEVLVGLSERPNDPFQVLVPSCVLQGPGAARRGAGAECVRTFGAAQLAGAAARRWDRVRLVCSQPYNKHCKYGLAFVHMSSPDGQPAPAPAAATAPAPASAPAPALALRLDAEAGSSDDEFRPGELFARHRLSQTTDAQIRQASSQALKNIPDASTRLTKTPIANTGKKDRPHDNDQRCDRRRDSLLYTDDDDRPHAKIDRVMQRHNQNNKQDNTDAITDKTNIKDKNNKPNDRTDRSNKLNISRPDTSNTNKITDGNGDTDKTKNKDKNNKPNDQTDRSNKLNISRANTSNTGKVTDGDGHTDKNDTSQKKDTEKNASNTEKAASQKKRKRSAETHPELGPVCSSLGGVLSGVVLAMSGYVNPQRAALRAAALELGAQYRRDWEHACTHLICAFPNTPKLKAVRAARAATVAVSGDWITQCHSHRRRLPWRWFATEPRDREPPPPGWERAAPASDEDTDDEIEKALVRMGKKQRRGSSDDQRDAARSSSRDRADDSDRARGRSSPAHATDADVTDADVTDADATDADATDAHATDADATDAHATDADATDAHATDADATPALDASRDSDVAFVRDERVLAAISVRSDSDATDEDERVTHADSVHIEKPLPRLWAGRTFVLSRRLRGENAALLARYIRAYGGLVLREEEVLEECSVQYVVVGEGELEGEGEGELEGEGEGEGEGARRVPAAWVWRQHRRAGGHERA